MTMSTFRFTTSNRRHHGTIKPVEATTGEHAGKWVCHINGPGVAADGTSFETIYSAPYIGAAKAGIAKFLKITVSELETIQSSSKSDGDGNRTCDKESVDPTSEFDDGGDDELVNFDLHAAVSSAKKQLLPPPRQKAASSPYTTLGKTSPLNPYKMQPKDSPAFAAAPASNKPPRHPKQNGRIELPHCNPSQSSTQGDQNKLLNRMRKVAEELRQENERVHKEIATAKKQKEELDREANAIRQENERARAESRLLERENAKLKGKSRAVREEYECASADLEIANAQREMLKDDGAKGESKSAKQEKDKLKGQTRALQEEYEKVKTNLKVATEHKERLDKSVHAAHERKEQYEKEAKAAKEALNSYRTEMESLQKQNLPQRKSAEGTNSNDSEGPSKKKRKTSKQASKGGTIIKSMKVGVLHEEAMARGMDPKVLLRMNKTNLLNEMVVGSPCITATDTWREVLRLRERFRMERREFKEQEDKRQLELQMQREKREREREEKEEAEREERRTSEKAAQVHKHTHHFGAVHPCKLAKTADLLYYGGRRYADCSECMRGDAVYTWEECDYDICQNCFRTKTMTPAERKAEAKRKAALEKQRREEEAERMRLYEKEEEERRKKWDAKLQFKAKIINPPKKNLDPDGNKKKGFTVWCSDGYDYDGWHSYEGPPDKEFDATYKTKEDANERARYLFHWKNPWGHEPEKIDEEEEVNKSVRDGLATYVVSPPDSTTWTVGVVPDAAYAHMENATLRHHRNDYDVGYGSSGGTYGLAY